MVSNWAFFPTEGLLYNAKEIDSKGVSKQNWLHVYNKGLCTYSPTRMLKWSIGLEGSAIVVMDWTISRAISQMYTAWNGVGIGAPATTMYASPIVSTWRSETRRKRISVLHSCSFSPSLPHLFIHKILLCRRSFSRTKRRTFDTCYSTWWQRWAAKFGCRFQWSQPRHWTRLLLRRMSDMCSRRPPHDAACWRQHEGSFDTKVHQSFASLRLTPSNF